MEHLIEWLAGFMWNGPVITFCLFAGIYFTLKFKFVQVKAFKHAIALVSGKYDDPNEKGQITHFQALAAALSGTIGLGNIAGVAIAISLGGPGAIFWMWIVGFLGMGTKYVECTLGTHYREEDPETGEVRGGPMHYITNGLDKKWHWLATFYGFCIFLGAFGVGNMFQTNQAADALHSSFNVPIAVSGIVLAVLCGLVIIGGIKRIGQVASKIVPTMCVIYVLGALLICLINYDLIPHVFSVILTDAFTGAAAAGGAIGTVIIWGVRRATFSNEAGLGSAAIAHAAVKTNYPIREGIVASLGPLIDTIVVCTATAMVIILSGNYGTERYNPTGDQLALTPAIVMAQEDTITRQNVPQNTHPVIKYTTNDNVLAIKGNSHSEGTILPSLTINAKEGIKDGIRFSYYKQNGDLKVRVRDTEDTILTSFIIGEAKANTYVNLEGYVTPGKWNSAVITFNDSFKDLIQSADGRLDSLKLEFIPQSSNTQWFIDRIQAVSKLEGISLTTKSFDKFFKGFGSIFISVAVFLFAFSTLITWYYYGETAIMFVLGSKIVIPYKLMFIVLAYYGAINNLSFILNLSDLMIALIVVPNMAALLLLAPKVKQWSDDYFKKLKSGEIKPYKH